jgi:hypothetical protein
MIKTNLLPLQEVELSIAESKEKNANRRARNTEFLSKCLTDVNDMLVLNGIHLNNERAMYNISKKMDKFYKETWDEQCKPLEMQEMYSSVMTKYVFEIFKNKGVKGLKILKDIIVNMENRYTIEDIDEDPYLSGLYGILKSTYTLLEMRKASKK